MYLELLAKIVLAVKNVGSLGIFLIVCPAELSLRWIQNELVLQHFDCVLLILLSKQ